MPTLYLTNPAGRKDPLRGGSGAAHLITIAPPKWLLSVSGRLCVVGCPPSVRMMMAAKSGALPLTDYEAACRREWAKRPEQLRPGRLVALDAHAWLNRAGTVLDERPVADGDALLCTCGAGVPCHRRWLAEVLAAAGWRVLLDGAELVDGRAPPLPPPTPEALPPAAASTGPQLGLFGPRPPAPDNVPPPPPSASTAAVDPGPGLGSGKNAQPASAPLAERADVDDPAQAGLQGVDQTRGPGDGGQGDDFERGGLRTPAAAAVPDPAVPAPADARTSAGTALPPPEPLLYAVEELVSLDGRRVPTDLDVCWARCAWVEVARFGDEEQAAAWCQRRADRADARRHRGWAPEADCHRLVIVSLGLLGEAREVVEETAPAPVPRLQVLPPVPPPPAPEPDPEPEIPPHPVVWRVIEHCDGAYSRRLYFDLPVEGRPERDAWAEVRRKVAETGRPWRLYRINANWTWSPYNMPLYPAALAAESQATGRAA